MALIERLVVGLLAFLISACAATHLQPPPQLPPLRVGVTPDAAPYAFWQQDHYAGIELDFARRLAHELGRPLEIVPVAWDEQIPTLLAGRTDVIMSGMSITPKRAARVAFGAPYLTTSLEAVVRSEDAERWPTPEALLQTSPRIGVKAGTTGEGFVRQRRPNENIVVYRRSRDAITELIAYRIDVYVGDAPVIAEAVAMNAGKLVAYPRDVGKQSLAWAFHPEDEDLRRFANALLERWRADGTLRQVLDTWSQRPK
jgi:polar amino acid transport system substrate-binding protein